MTEREGAPISFVGFWDSPGPSAIHPSPDTTILNYLNDRERGRHYLLQDLGTPPMPLTPPPTPQYLTILMTERGHAIIFLQDFRAPNAPAKMSQYLTILITERGAPLSCLGLWCPPPSPDATILSYFNDKERGRHYLLQDLKV